MPIVQCLIIAMNVCFSAEPVRVAEVHTPSSDGKAVLEAIAPGYDFQIPNLDYVGGADWRVLPRACHGDICVSYAKQCRPSSAGVTCYYQYSPRRGGDESELYLTAKSREDMGRAEQSIGILFDSGDLGQPQIFSLDEMKEEYSGKMPQCQEDRIESCAHD